MPAQILIVDDDAEFREELREALFAYRTMEACSGQEALEIIRKPHAIDVVLLDVFMPGLNGTQVLKEMKRLVPRLGIIILTGAGSKDVAVDALRGHADDYLEKPLAMEQLFKAIQRLVMHRSFPGAPQAHRGLGKMERAKVFLEHNFDKKVGLKDVSAELCLSPKYLSRLFKEKTGTGFNDYRLKIKIEKASELLRAGAMNVSEVADKLGYKNLESFVRIFKKMTGETPRGRQRRAAKSHGKPRLPSCR